MKDRYDVLVIGAGPAGSIAARTAAEKGLDVLLIEKRQEIGDPVRCAEGVNKEYLKKVGFSNYDKIINLFSDLKTYQKEIFELMGKNQSYNYLVILQNTNEKRPN